MAPPDIASASTSAIGSKANGSIDEVTQRRSRRQLERNESTSSSTSARQASHHHLGLLPMSTDSLHTRIRSKNPTPKHVSKIEDVTASSPVVQSPSVDLKRESSTGSRSYREGISSSSRLSDADTDAYKASNPNEDGEDGHQTITTDIGIYDEAIYDEYLGSIMGPLRRLLIRSLRWESPMIAKHQAMVRSPRLDKFFVYTSLLGTHSFFLIFLPMAFWIGNARFARGLVNVLAFGVYISGAVKDALCIPRPISPPVTRLVVGTTHLEYGFLSTHSTNSVSIALYLYLWLQQMRAEQLLPTYMESKLCEAALLYYVGSVVYGRIYCGMHSVMDCAMGSALGAIVTMAQWYYFDLIEDLTLSGGWSIPIVVVSVGLVLVVAHPQPLDDCPCFEDSVAFVSVVMGIVTARWTNVRYGLLPRDDNPLGKGSRIMATVISPIEQVIKQKLLHRQPDTLLATSIDVLLDVLLKASKVAIGVVVILAARLTVKTICRIILPPIFRFAQGTFGFVLPRRHYKKTTRLSRLSHNHQRLERPAHKRQSSSAGGEFFSNKSDPAQYDEAYWKADSRSTMQQRQDQAQAKSLSERPLRAERNKVKFTLGDYKDLPVPFTHPNTHILGDTFSERVAGALSMDEKQRQQQELEWNFQFPTRKEGQTEKEGEANGEVIAMEDDGFAHYDIDVLTKVFVYHAIGFVTSCCLPAVFARWNW